MTYLDINRISELHARPLPVRPGFVAAFVVAVLLAVGCAI